MHKIMAQKEIMNFFSDNENFERGPPRHAGGNGNQGINFVWPYASYSTYYLASCSIFLYGYNYYLCVFPGEL